MSASSPYIPGHYLLQLMGSGLLPESITQYLEEHLKKTGLDPLQLDSARLTPQSLEALLLAWPEIQPQSLAVAFGDQVTLTSQGNLSLLIMTAATLREAWLATPTYTTCPNHPSRTVRTTPLGRGAPVQWPQDTCVPPHLTL